MNINVNGKIVSVDDSFGQLSPEEQQSTIEDIKQQLSTHHSVKQEVAKPTSEPSMLDRIISDPTGAALAAGNEALKTVQNYPKTAGLLTDIGLAALPQTNIPILNQAQKVAKAPWQLAQGALNSVDAYTASNNANALGQLEHNVRQYVKAGQPVPPELQNAVNSLRSKIAGSMTSPIQPIAPTATPSMGQTAASVAQRPSYLQQGMEYYNKVRQVALNKVLQNAPGVAEAAGNFGRAVAPALSTVGRIASAVNPFVTGAQLATFSKPLGPAVPSTGPMRGSEINPSTGKGWTPQELQQYSQQYR